MVLLTPTAFSTLQDNNSIGQEQTQAVKICLKKDFDGLKGYERVKIIKQGNHIADTLFMQKQSCVNAVKLSKDHYLVCSTGEVKEYTHTEKKELESLKKTFATLRQYINTNFEGLPNEFFVTLTYAENMQDRERLYKDFEHFFKRLKRAYKHYEFAYIVVAEPQERGAWHLHLLLKVLNVNYAFIPFEQLSALWKQGSIDIDHLKNVDNAGAYFSAYFTNLQVEASQEGDGIQRGRDGKMYRKGARLHFYPKGFKFFRTSRNIKHPEIEQTTYAKVIQEYGEPVYTVAYDVQKDDENINCIVKNQFNKRKQGK